MSINTFHFSSGHLNERLLRETAKQQGVTLTDVLQPCGGCLEAQRVRAGVPRRTTSQAAKPMETVHIDPVGPYEPSMGGSVYLIMFVDSASRWMRPYGMAGGSETTECVQTFIIGMNNGGHTPFGRPTVGNLPAGATSTSATPRGFAASARPRLSHNRTR